jgi:hypothetical protein
MRSSKRASTKRKANRTASKGTNKTKRPAAKEVLPEYVDATAEVLKLPLPPAWRVSVIGNLQTTLRLAASFADFPLPDEAEPAPVFVP